MKIIKKRHIRYLKSEYIVLTLFLVIIAIFNLSCGGGCSSKKTAIPDIDKPEVSLINDTNKSIIQKDEVKSDELVKAGRAYEMGMVDESLKIASSCNVEDEKCRYLKSIIYNRKGDYEKSANLCLHQFKHFELQKECDHIRVNSLFNLKDYKNAISFADGILEKKYELSISRKRDLNILKGDSYYQLGDFDNAIKSFQFAQKWSNPKLQESIQLKIARALEKTGHKSDAEKILLPLALNAKKGSVMKEAHNFLNEINRPPSWNNSKKIERIETFISLKEWASAEKSINDLLESVKGNDLKTLNWLNANLMFNRRGHYKEAVEAFLAVEKSDSSHKDAAMFLRARALSRLDLDEDAILVFRKYANITKNAAKKDEALFFAARLEYYIGKHEGALKNIEKIAPAKPKKGFKSNLIPGTLRDAHFIGGMSAFLTGKYDVAIDHFKLSQVGSQSAEAIEKNKYWQAVSAFMNNNENGKTELYNLCENDPTSWYSFFAAKRLTEAGLPPESCPVLSDSKVEDIVKGDSDSGLKVRQNSNISSVPLNEVSSTASLYADMGLFKLAAEALYNVEKSKKINMKNSDWFALYNQLDAPQYAIKRANIGFKWEQRDQDIVRTMAAYPAPYDDLVTELEKELNLPGMLIFSIARKESLFDPFALSWVGAMGMMQMMPATYATNAKRASLPPLKSGELPGPTQSLKAGAQELSFLLKKYNDRLPLAIMGYNAGTGAVDRWLERSGDFRTDVFVEKAGFAQTRNYVKRVYSIMYRYSLIYSSPLPYLPYYLKKTE
ncbi:MAG: transglycosylase SLT domain-containing protein [Deltaproteobacteria bacterium]|nr:transglycosylase SLT domain-containing protein [Deltaproteobacteria bacterium]